MGSALMTVFKLFKQWGYSELTGNATLACAV